MLRVASQDWALILHEATDAASKKRWATLFLSAHQVECEQLVEQNNKPQTGPESTFMQDGIYFLHDVLHDACCLLPPIGLGRPQQGSHIWAIDSWNLSPGYSYIDCISTILIIALPCDFVTKDNPAAELSKERWDLSSIYSQTHRFRYTGMYTLSRKSWSQWKVLVEYKSQD